MFYEIQSHWAGGPVAENMLIQICLWEAVTVPLKYHVITLAGV